jgi:hypothetical protein
MPTQEALAGYQKASGLTPTAAIPVTIVAKESQKFGETRTCCQWVNQTNQSMHGTTTKKADCR